MNEINLRNCYKLGYHIWHIRQSRSNHCVRAKVCDWMEVDRISEVYKDT